MPLKLDLRNLTDELVAQALPHLGQCFYSSPCIIGSLIPEDQRARLDNCNGELGVRSMPQPGVGGLVAQGEIEFPEGQLSLASTLQVAFDNNKHGDRRRFLATLAEVRKELAQ